MRSSGDEALCAAAVPVRVEQTAGKMHNKLMVVDAGGADPRVVTGSLNWTAAGDARNSENIVILRDVDVAQMYMAAFAQWWEGSPSTPGCEENALLLHVYLPLVVGGSAPESTPVPTPVATLTPTLVPATPTATLTPTPTATRSPTGPCSCSANLYTVTTLAHRRRRRAVSTSACRWWGRTCTGWTAMEMGWRARVCRWGGG